MLRQGGKRQYGNSFNGPIPQLAQVGMFGIKNQNGKSIQILPTGFCIFKKYQDTLLEYLMKNPISN